MNNSFTILVNSFDGYSDVWPYFFEIFHKYWKDCPLSIKLVANYKDYPGTETIKTGDERDWISRTIFALEHIETPFVVLLLEDYFLSRPIDNSFVQKITNYVVANNLNYLRLIEIPKSRAKRKGDFLPVYSNEEYGVNLQASIWKVDFLKQTLLSAEKGSAWDFEVYLLKNREKIKQPLPACFTLRKNPFGFHNGVLKGKWFNREIKYYKKRGITIDYTNRGRLKFWEEKRFTFSVFLKSHTPYFFRRLLKRILKVFGVKFVSDE